MTSRRVKTAFGYLVDALRDAWFAMRTPRWIHELENEPERVDPDTDGSTELSDHDDKIVLLDEVA